MLRKRSPALAAILGGLLGPIGYIYIGWRYALACLLMLLPLPIAVAVLGFGLPPLTKYFVLLVLARKAYTICRIRNENIERGETVEGPIDSFSFAGIQTADLLTGQAMACAAAVGIEISRSHFTSGRVLQGLFSIAITTPILVGVAALVFGLISGGLRTVWSRRLEAPN